MNLQRLTQRGWRSLAGVMRDRPGGDEPLIGDSSGRPMPPAPDPSCEVAWRPVIGVHPTVPDRRPEQAESVRDVVDVGSATSAVPPGTTGVAVTTIEGSGYVEVDSILVRAANTGDRAIILPGEPVRFVDAEGDIRGAS